MNNQQTQDEIKKKGIQINPSRDEGPGEEINPAEIDKSEVELDRDRVEFGGGQEEGQPSQPEQPEKPDQPEQ